MNEPRLSCCLTFDFDAVCLWLTTFGQRGPSARSRGEFGAVAVPRPRLPNPPRRGSGSAR